MVIILSSEGHAPGTLHSESGVSGLEEKLGKTGKMLQLRRQKVLVPCWVIVSEVGRDVRDRPAWNRRYCVWVSGSGKTKGVRCGSLLDRGHLQASQYILEAQCFY